MEIKTGKELIDNFFEKIGQREEFNKEVVNILLELFKSDDLTERNISNKLDAIIRNEKN